MKQSEEMEQALLLFFREVEFYALKVFQTV
jgi:hypothetical protein